ncbi:sulfite exporter TauE/SafE family protein [Geoalkalibacter sp.]|uniref:sulfite exporter TauE/SafE family protein n=1 Tax=Geoalkalibacter sp. TaxID=3041440 RepID=UPI00272ECB23|nr:sulfite exporter TauE/SafE family protein [Geoalkalibacter sp.]
MAAFSPEIVALFLLLGLVNGFVAGLFGIGGGVILVPLFLWAFAFVGFAPDLIVHIAFGTSLAIIIPTAFSATLGNRKRGNVRGRQVLALAGGSLLGAACGSWLAAELPGTVLKALFGVMQIGVGLKMFLFRPHLPPEAQGRIARRKLLAVGFAGGAFSAFFGIGGGVVTVPLLVIALRLPIHLAIGNSSALIVVSSLVGTLSYVAHGWNVPGLPPHTLGYVHALVALMVAPLSILGARLGVRLAARMRTDRLMQVFAVFLIAVGLYMVVSLWL